MRWTWLWLVVLSGCGDGLPNPWGGALDAVVIQDHPVRVSLATNRLLYLKSAAASRNAIVIGLGGATANVWVASGGGDWSLRGLFKGGTHELAVPFGAPLYVAIEAEGAPGQASVGWATPRFDGDRPTADEYSWGFGGDLDDDGKVDELDVQLINDALGGLSPLQPEYDFDGNGVVDELDRQAVEDVAAAIRPALLSADAFESDSTTGAMLEIHGMALQPGSQVMIAGELMVPLDSVSDDDYGAKLATVAISDEQLDILRSFDGQRVRLVEDAAPGVPLHAGLDWTELEGETLADNAPSAPSPTPRAAPPANCCYVKLVTFTAAAKGLKLRAYAVDDHGQQATHKKSEDSDEVEVGIDLRDPGGRPNTLSGPFREAHFRLVDKDGGTLAELVINCDTKAPITISEQQPPAAPGMTVSNPRELVRILSIETETKPCAETAMPSVATGSTVVPWDNMTWPGHGPSPTPHPASGAIALFAADASTFANVGGCKKACWAQVVETRIDVQKNGAAWTKLIDDPPHNDNLDAKDKMLFPGSMLAGKYPWYCYAFQSHSLEGTMPRITLRDGPHIDHQFSYKDEKGMVVPLGNNDVLRRRSSFYTKLLCVDPMLATPLEAFSWTITTLYSPMSGARTRVDGPNRETPTPDNPRAQVCRSKSRLEAFLRKKKARESK